MRNGESGDVVCRMRRQMIIAAASSPLWLSNAARLLADEAEEKTTRTPSAEETPKEIPKIKLRILYDNNRDQLGLKAAWGFSCLVEGLDKTVLFDCGERGQLLKENMARLGLLETKIDAVVLSHIHEDHTGGLEAIAEGRPGLKVYTPSGFPKEFIRRVRSLGAEPIEADKSMGVCPRALTTGTLGKGEIEEHGLCIRSKRGWLVLTGCAHPGPDAMVAAAKKLTGEAPYLVVGGFHMGGWAEDRIKAMVDRLEELGVKRVAPCHCTGDEARKHFKERFKGRCSLVGVGARFHLPAYVEPEAQDQGASDKAGARVS